MKTEARTRLRKLPALFLLAAAPSLAQDAEIQKQLIQRQQQSDAFTLRLRHSQEALKIPPGDLKTRQAVEAQQLSESQRLENVSEKQLREVSPDTPPEFRPQERQRASDERAPLTIPSGGIVQPVESPR